MRFALDPRCLIGPLTGVSNCLFGYADWSRLKTTQRSGEVAPRCQEEKNIAVLPGGKRAPTPISFCKTLRPGHAQHRDMCSRSRSV